MWPGRTNAGGHRDARSARRPTALDWTEPIDLSIFARRILAPALTAVGLPVSTPATPARTLGNGAIGPARSATQGVRLHDLRYTAAVAWLTAGVPVVQVSRWLCLTLSRQSRSTSMAIGCRRRLTIRCQSRWRAMSLAPLQGRSG